MLVIQNYAKMQKYAKILFLILIIKYYTEMKKKLYKSAEIRKNMHSNIHHKELHRNAKNHTQSITKHYTEMQKTISTCRNT